VIDHDIARPRVESHHSAPVHVRELAIRDSADVEGEDRPDVAEGHEVQEPHPRRARTSEGMLDRAKLRHDCRL
jgi:hypothetical protein